MSKLCPECGSIAFYNSHFRRYQCSECNWERGKANTREIDTSIEQLLHGDVPCPWWTTLEDPDGGKSQRWDEVPRYASDPSEALKLDRAIKKWGYTLTVTRDPDGYFRAEYTRGDESHKQTGETFAQALALIAREVLKQHLS